MHAEACCKKSAAGSFARTLKPAVKLRRACLLLPAAASRGHGFPDNKQAQNPEPQAPHLLLAQLMLQDFLDSFPS